MDKMTTEERLLYTRYFYNSVVEFICFVILYLETFETASLTNINKYVRFFKTEVTHLISSFKGEVSTDKLIQMLKTLDCFIICENEIKLNKNTKWKDVIFEDFVISKCVDLLLRQQNNIDAMCKNLNLNRVVKINAQNLLHILEKYSHISVCSNRTVTLHHFHGLIGFEDHICKSVLGYFHDILYHSNVLSYEDVRNHSKSLSICGLNNMIEILSILYCSHQFSCQDGYICLSKKSKKYLKQKPINIDKMEINFSSRSMHMGQIVFGVYGPALQHWFGEIGFIKKNYGVIYCVVDFSNGSQGIFTIFFCKAALKVISELDDLQKYINVRDAVEFDAEYYKGKMLDRCWKATRVKLCSDKFQHDESLSDKLNQNTELERHKCANNKCCSKINSKVTAFDSNSQNIKNKYCEDKHVVQKKLKTSDYESWSSGDSNSGLEIDRNDNSNAFHNQISSTDFSFDASYEHVLDYLFVFGHIYLLMEDKGIAIAKYGSKFYNILFMKDSIYAPNASEHLLVKGQKILAVIPYLKNLKKFDSVCISILVYGLNESETDETESLNVSPKEFAVKMLFSKLSSLCNNCYNFSCPFNSLPQEFLDSDLNYKTQLTKFYDFIKSQYRLPFTDDKMLPFLHYIGKAHLNDGNFDFFKFFMKMVKCLPRNTNREKIRRKLVSQDANCRYDVPPNTSQQDLCVENFKKMFFSENDVSNSYTKTFGKRVHSENDISNLHLTIKPDSLSSLTSFGSYKTCSTNCSEVFYSCESASDSPKNIIFDKDALGMLNCEASPTKIEAVPKIDVTEPLPTVFNEMCTILSMKSSQCLEMKEQQHLQKKYKNVTNLADNKYLSLQSVPSLKCSFKNRKRAASSCSFKKTANKSCVRNPITLKAQVSLVSKSFIFVATNINGQDIILPFPKKDIPSSLVENVKLNSSCEITVVPNVVLHLSHILTFRLCI